MIRLAVRCPAEVAEAVLAELLELAPNGVEETYPAAPGREAEEAAGSGSGWVEYAVYGVPGELPELGELDASVGGGLVEVSSSEIPDDWADRWRDFHRPVVIADRLRVRPSWEEARALANPAAPAREAEEAADSYVDVVVDPGQAFGTGAHPTTRMCLELLLELADRGEADGGLTDLGTGSGVLAIAAAKLGWAPVQGCDHERAALAAAAANADANGVKLELERVNLREKVPELAPTVVANLTAPLLVHVAGRLRRGPRWLVVSGTLGPEVERVEDAFGRPGLVAAERRQSGEWAALLLSDGTRDGA